MRKKGGWGERKGSNYKRIVLIWLQLVTGWLLSLKGDLQRCCITDASKFSERQGFIQQFTPPICQSCLPLGETQGKRWEVCVPRQRVEKVSSGCAHSNSEAWKPRPGWALRPAAAPAAGCPEILGGICFGCSRLGQDSVLGWFRQKLEIAQRDKAIGWRNDRSTKMTEMASHLDIDAERCSGVCDNSVCFYFLSKVSWVENRRSGGFGVLWTKEVKTII